MKISKIKNFRILSILSKYTLIFIIAFSLLMPLVVVNAWPFPVPQPGVPCTDKDSAGNPTPKGCDPKIPINSSGTNTGDSSGTNTGDSSGTNSGVKIETGIINPIDGINDIPSFIEAIIQFVLIIGIPIVTLAIIYSGFLFVTASGNSEKLKKAKQTLLYTLIGAALLLGSYVIAHAIKGTVDEINTAATK